MKEKNEKKELSVPSELSNVPGASAEVLTFLKPAGLSESALFDIRLCLEEALINAIKYGNQLRKDLNARLLVEYNDHEVKVTVEDRGSGFDPKKVANCTEGNNLLRGHGRGVHLIRRLMDKVEYNERGNLIRMTKFLNSKRRNP